MHNGKILIDWKNACRATPVSAPRACLCCNLQILQCSNNEQRSTFCNTNCSTTTYYVVSKLQLQRTVVLVYIYAPMYIYTFVKHEKCVRINSSYHEFIMVQLNCMVNITDYEHKNGYGYSYSLSAYKLTWHRILNSLVNLSSILGTKTRIIKKVNLW